MPTAEPFWGYDLAKVPTAPCRVCGELIGREPYVEASGMARFGVMEVLHKRCDRNGIEARANAKRKKRIERERDHLPRL